MTTYRLVREQRPDVAPPRLDAAQQAVVDHPGGPLLVLAGPGTGKTTTLVEAIARRIDDGADPASVLALTFSRKAAEQLRDRVTARVGRTVATSMSSTFHSFAFGLIRRFAFKHSESSYAHWLPLMLADRLNVVEGLVSDLATGRVPNVFAERGWTAEWTHNRSRLVGKILVGAAVATLAASLIVKRRARTRALELTDGHGPGERSS